ncbi:MAG: cytochrome c biogenesis protein CcsA [Anaerolineae bacterium]|nr:cytochrome c biogenesis protein CcsA [Anaerolineae bacterium]
MNAATFFVIGTVLYGASGYLYLAGWLVREPRAREWAPRLLGGAVALYVLSMALRWRTFGFPFLTLREVLSVYAWVLALLYLFLEWRIGYSIIGVLVTPVGSLMILIASLLPAAQEPLLPLLQDAWLMIHTGTLLAAYAAFTVAFAAALAYVLQDWSLRRRKLAWRLPSLPVMDNLSRWLVTIGLVLMIGAIISGSTWARKAWGQAWVWQPKQVLALVTVAIYGSYFFVRNVSHWSVRKASWIVIVGFLSVLTTFIGADLLAPTGLHSFLFR